MTSVPVPSLSRSTSSLDAVKGSGVVTPAAACVVAIALACLSLAPVFESGTWFGPVLIVTLAVVGVGALAMWVRLPLFLVPVLQVVALFSVLVAKYATSAVWGFLPSTDSLTELRAVLTRGMHDINIYAPPVPVTSGVAAVAALGIGCLAIVVFVLQVALRMPVIAGLALVGVYVVPSLVLDDGSPWWAFAALAIAFMVLLVSDERVGLVSWGRMLRRSDAGPASPFAGLSSAAMRLGSVAIAAAVVLPVIVPGIADAVLGRSTSGTSPNGSGSGSAGGGELSPLVELRKHLISQTDDLVLTYRSERADVGLHYLPTAILTSYRDEQWRAVPLSVDTATPLGQGVPPDTSIAATLSTPASQHQTTFTTTGRAPRFLPVPEHFTAITVTGDASWYVDNNTRTVFADPPPDTPASWTVDWSSAQPTAEQLQAALPEQRTPDEVTSRPSLSPVVQGLAQEILARSGAETPYEEARAIQDYFRDPANGFTYSTNDDVTAQSGTYLDDFLTTKVGYCQQYAATMALLAEAMGISSRVVVGYTQGGAGSDGTYVVRGKDAHAWPELKFAGIGWVRFEPTPSAAGTSVTVPPYGTGAIPKRPDDPQTPAACVARGGRACPSKKTPPSHNHPREEVGGVIPATSLALDQATSADTWRLRGILALLVIAVIAAAVPAVLRWLRRRRRLSEQAAIEDMWNELRDTARDLGIPWSTAQTPRQAVASVIAYRHLRGDEADAATRLGRATERARYAPTAPSSVGLADDVETVRHALWRRADRGQKWRATLLPASLRDQDDVRT
jgi:transglutaminase-like putative cysteine protease